ncbi:class I SAM-dependent methyltransferase [Symbioplanes lichenis]|uniref:class I SAM-dependent methyltransferase n=1 Tax=Symbioplanes lichenis TaxID=1629072 RepID=UPI00273926C2|nr:class I SAM-dependent methyltransferase [Actinoplanes lichenis]
MTVRMLGGEMADWSDADPAGGPAYSFLMSALPTGGRVLVAGPHSGDVIEALRAYSEVTCLVRSQPDAEALSATGVSVLCGDIAKLPDDQYDLVVALDGTRRLCSVESPQYDWAGSVQALRRALRPGGALLLAVENELGVHRLVDRTTATAGHTDADWQPVGEYDESRPGTPARLREQLGANGLSVAWSATAWPLPAAPTLIADESRLRYGPAGALSAAIASAVATAYAAKPVLSDPRRLAATAVRAGLGPELAPVWLVLAFEGTAPQVSLPAAVLGDGPMPPLPDGRLLEELLLAACLRHDLPALRRLLSAWVTQLPGQTADNVLVDGSSLVPLFAAPDESDVIRRFAAVVLGGGYDHPWPAAGDVDTLSAILRTAAGLEPGPLPSGDALPPPDSLREHEERVRRLEEQLADAGERIRHTEAELAKREGALRKAQLQIDLFSGKATYRISKLGARAARKAVRLAFPKDK